MLLAVVIPVYNEAMLLRASLDRLLAITPPAGCERLVILIDDGSTDGSREQLAALASDPRFAVVLHERNQGKGAAVRSGFELAIERRADLVLIHDADLEYDPADHAAACAPILEERADVVIGTRFGSGQAPASGWFHWLVNMGLTLASNMLTGLRLSDMECCTKVFRRAVIERIRIQENRFGLEPELVAKVARLRLPDVDGISRRVRIVQVPVSYDARSHSQGKKIGWKDGVSALRCIARYSLGGDRAQ
ncbi:MAG: glycosyltransferase family 2 protein [Phycisphaerales bacterium]|nr:glycosyltransferase family 2 protein [Phycisphaerales bacterium]